MMTPSEADLSMKKPGERRILMISLGYYPCAAIGVHRAASFSNHFSDLGWRTTVLTVREEYYPLIHPFFDKQLEARISPEVEIVRTGYCCAAQLRGMRHWLNHLSGNRSERGSHRHDVPSPGNGSVRSWSQFVEFPFGIGWLPFGLRTGLPLARKSDVIWATSPPTGSLCLGAMLSLLTGRPFVADFRDPWELEARWGYATPLHKAIDKVWKSFVLRQANMLVVVNEVMEKTLKKDYAQHAHKVVTIYNGHDEERISVPDRVSKPGRTVRIGYFGVLSYGRWRSMEAVLRALTEYSDRDGPFGIQLVYRGPEAEELQRIATKLGLLERMDIKGTISHAEVCRLMKEMDILLLLGSEGFEYALPGKIFEYLSASSPILAVGPEGAISGFLDRHQAGICVTTEDSGQISESITAILLDYERFCNRTVDAAHRFSRRVLANEYSQMMKRLLPVRMEEDYCSR